MQNQNQKIQNFLKAKSYKLKASEGITLYLAMLVMGGAVAVALSVSTVFIGEFKITSDTVNSLKAVYVADSAMEYVLYQTRPEATYDAETEILTTNKFGPIALSDSAPTEFLSSADCHTEIGFGAMNIICSARARLVLAGSTPGCAANLTASCTEIITSASYGGVNRAMEIVYPNL